MKNGVFWLLLLISFTINAQPVQNPDAAEILHDIQKLKVLGSVLYVAAHPDDENTRLIAWLANEKMVQTAYLSLTRGDGGQNLIGPEIREELGIIRTQELLAARRIDGGKQFFTRANDFGYSKSPEETLEVWDEDKILADVVWAIRKFRPDIIITRFPVNGGGGHGHHTASAMLAHKAFELSGDPEVYPEQLKYVEPWQPRRLYLNTGRWWNPDISSEDPGVLSVDVGAYNRILGISYSEMAARSRSMHKSQGFGATGNRGVQHEYLEYRLGDQAEMDVLEDIEMTWNRVGAPEINEKIESIINNYNPGNPSASVISLLELRNNIKDIKNKHWREVKLASIDKIIKDALGLYLEATTENPLLVPEEASQLKLEITNRSDISIHIQNILFPPSNSGDTTFIIEPKEKVIVENTFSIAENDNDYTLPYWLKNKPEKGYYVVHDQQKIGKPENDPELAVQVKLAISNKVSESSNINFTVPLQYKWNDPVEGELRRPVAIVPPVALTFGEEIYLFPEQKEKSVNVRVKNMGSRFAGEIRLELPDGWIVSPERISVNLTQPLEEKNLTFTVAPPKGQSSVVAEIIATSKGKAYSNEVSEITYSHIPIQTLVARADAEFIKLNVKVAGNKVGYIEGAGDAIPSTLRELGYEVDILSEDQLNIPQIDSYDAIILGIRALNTNERIAFMMPSLLDYISRGGVLITQYNTSHRVLTDNFAPYPLTLSRDRVTVEEAPVTILSPQHPALNYPNKITDVDFENWVQERGLYFPNKWDDRYVPLLSIKDPGEKAMQGSLLVAPYGKGFYVYSGISWFRQLPAGVPGAIRIFSNLLSLGSSDEQGN